MLLIAYYCPFLVHDLIIGLKENIKNQEKFHKSVAIILTSYMYFIQYIIFRSNYFFHLNFMFEYSDVYSN